MVPGKGAWTGNFDQSDMDWGIYQHLCVWGKRRDISSRKSKYKILTQDHVSHVWAARKPEWFLQSKHSGSSQGEQDLCESLNGFHLSWKATEKVYQGRHMWSHKITLGYCFPKWLRWISPERFLCFSLSFANLLMGNRIILLCFEFACPLFICLLAKLNLLVK